jgi:hypothetical protein
MAEKSINYHKKYEVLHESKGEFLNGIKLTYRVRKKNDCHPLQSKNGNN